MLAVGDSITNGVGDRYSADNISEDIELAGIRQGPRIVGIRSYASNLHDLLTQSAAFAAPNAVVNSGRPGDRSDQTDARLDSILERHSGATDLLVLIGINDALSSLGPDPGLGCSGNACNGTFKGTMQSIIDKATQAGKVPMLSKITGAFGSHKGSVFSNPTTARVNTTSRDYNAVLSELTVENGLPPGPDLYQFFLESGPSRISLSADNLHPNALGHVAMARLWFNALTGASGAPFILRNLCVRVDNAGCAYPSSYSDVKYYRQNLLEEGDPYYIDLAFTLTNVPAELDGGIWIQTANAHRGNTRTNYLTFDLDRAVDVYVAFDTAPSAVPSWLNSYTDTGRSLGVSAPGGRLRLLRRSYPAGSTVQLGGASAPGVIGSVTRNYVVIVQPR
jgi:lysophospholipase L1-like esterase